MKIYLNLHKRKERCSKQTSCRESLIAKLCASSVSFSSLSKSWLIECLLTSSVSLSSELMSRPTKKDDISQYKCWLESLIKIKFVKFEDKS